jgi:hypothetical protein
LYCLSFCLLVIVLSVLLSFGYCIVCPSVFWLLYCLSFCLLVIILSVLLSFGYCIVCPVFWLLYCLSFSLLVIVLSVLLSFGHCIVCLSSTTSIWLPLWYYKRLVQYLKLEKKKIYLHINSLLLFQTNGEKTKNKKYHTVGIFPKSNRKIVERDKIDTPSTQIHDRSLSWLGTGISLQYKVTGLS